MENVEIRYKGFDGLRALCALGIAMMHYQAFIVVKPSENFFTDRCIPFFTEFVFMFFMISAFGLCCGYYNKLKGDENGQCAFNVNLFYSRRIKKIWPYFALLVFIDVIVYFLQNGFTPTHDMKGELSEAFANLTLCFNLLPNSDFKVMGGGWFVGTIFLFYILFPFFCFLLHSKKRAWIALLVALVMHILVVNYFLTEDFVTVRIIDCARHNILYSFPFLFVGGMIFLYKNKIDIWISDLPSRWILLAVTAILTLIQVTFKPLIFGENRLFLLILFAFWLCYGMSNGIKIGGCRFLDNRVMKFLGDISMEIYLTHMMMFRALEKIHLENMIDNPDILFIVTYVVGITMTIMFAYFVKNFVFVKLGMLFSKAL